MIDTKAFLRDPRRRNLAILAAVAFVMVVLAVLAVVHEAHELAPRKMAQSLFPELAHEAGRVAHIRIQSHKGSLDIVFKPEKGWVVASHDDYPASFEQVRETIVGLAALVAIEPKTARQDWLPYLDLVSPLHGGNGTLITLMDDKGTILASLIAGKTTDIGDPSGAMGLFVRQPGDPQSWLARSVFEPKSDASDWLDKQVMTIDRARIAEADIDPLVGPSYVVRRDHPSDADFELTELPRGRALAYDGAPDGVAASVADFSFDDVRPARNFDFSDSAHLARIVTKTFDGLTVTVNVMQQGTDYWATVSAEGAPNSPDARKEARDIDAHAAGWAYKLPAAEGQQFTTTLESLLKPVGGAAPKAG
ncbi:MAG: DUF4340 domain-containing protein [Rhizomicrobium sp.]